MVKACATGDHCVSLWLLYESAIQVLFLFSKLAALPSFEVQKADHGFIQHLVCNCLWNFQKKLKLIFLCAIHGNHIFLVF